MNKNFVDIHCHYFNGKFAFRELLEIGWRKLNSNYPYNRDEKKMVLEFISLSSKLETLVEYVASLFFTLGRSAKKNYKHEQDCFKQSEVNNLLPLITSPLMMDIYFVADKGKYLDKKKFIEELPESDYRQAITPFEISTEEQEQFESFAEDLRQQVLSAVIEKRAVSKMQPEGIDTGLEEVEQALADVIAEFKYPAVEEDIADEGKGLVQLTRGFRKQLENLKNLKSEYPETVFPFFAVDPRRVGVAQLLEENLKNGAFAGVKLYPPLGYLPTHPDLYPIYDLCLQYNVPVTAHCSPGGFHTFHSKVKTESRDRNGNEETIEVIVAKGYDLSACSEPECRYFADPDNWVEILENDKYKDLRINLAHFGGEEQFLKYITGSPEKENWTAKIIKLIKQFDNLYTDISYYTNADIAPKIEQLISSQSILKERLMFGTDFIMILKDYMLTSEKEKALVDYFNHFEGLAEPLFSTNAHRFLGKIDTD